MTHDIQHRPVAIAVVGLGWVGTARHIPALLRNPSFRVLGVIDRDGARAKDVAARFGIPHAAASQTLTDVPFMDALDALSVAAAPMAHHDLVCAGLEAGKDVITEKPFAMTTQEGATMERYAQEKGRILSVVHNFQFGRAFKAFARAKERGTLGEITRLSAVQLGNPQRRLPSWYPQLPLGLFYDESPHFFYLLNRLAGGDLTLLDASAERGADTTPAEIRLFYRSQTLPVSMTCSFESPLSEWHLFVQGSKALGIIDIFRDFYIQLPNDGRHNLPDILRTSACGIAQHLWQYVPNGIDFLRGRLDYGNAEVFARFAQAIRTRTPDPFLNAAQARLVLGHQHDAIAGVRWR